MTKLAGMAFRLPIRASILHCRSYACIVPYLAQGHYLLQESSPKTSILVDDVDLLVADDVRPDQEADLSWQTVYQAALVLRISDSLSAFIPFNECQWLWKRILNG